MTHEQKLAAAKKFLGEKYLLHPKNRARKLARPLNDNGPLILDVLRHSYDPHKQGQ